MTLLASVKAEYDKEYSQVLANAVQQSALLLENRQTTDTQYKFTLVLCAFSAIADAYEFIHTLKDLPNPEKVRAF